MKICGGPKGTIVLIPNPNAVATETESPASNVNQINLAPGECQEFDKVVSVRDILPLRAVGTGSEDGNASGDNAGNSE